MQERMVLIWYQNFEFVFEWLLQLIYNVGFFGRYVQSAQQFKGSFVTFTIIILTTMTSRSFLLDTPQKAYLKYEDTNSRATAESSSEGESNFEFDVKPKRKYFETPQEKRQYVEEYTKKKKTELCKNFQLKGECKFGDDCSFAHGEHQLVPKVHLHTKYKTKPCKRFYKTGFCCYGNRCQYIHDEIRTGKQKEHWKYLNEVYKKEKIPVPVSNLQLSLQERFDVQRFQKLAEKMRVSPPDVILVSTSRLSIFAAFEERSILSDVSAQHSRKQSLSSN